MGIYDELLPILKCELKEVFHFDQSRIKEYTDNIGFVALCGTELSLKDIMIVASYLHQIDLTLAEVMNAYGVSKNYVDSIIHNELPSIRVGINYAITILESERSKKNCEEVEIAIRHLEDLNKRIDYCFEKRRSIKKIVGNIKDEETIDRLARNTHLLFLVNYLSVPEAIVFLKVLSRGTNDKNEYDVFTKICCNKTTQIKEELESRVEYLQNVPEDASLFDYQKLLGEYKELLAVMNYSNINLTNEGIKLERKLQTEI